MSTTEETLLSLHKSLVSIDCVTGNEDPCSKFLAQYLRDLGWTVEIQTVVPAAGSCPARENVFAYAGSNRDPRLILNSHIDVVPPYIPWREDEENVYGRGSTDAKGSVAAQIVAADELWKVGRIGEGDIGFLYVISEETDHVGMYAANDLNISPEFLVVGEPTESVLAKGHKGIVKFRVEVTGKAAHSGYPELGVSAIDALIEILYTLKHLTLPVDPRLGETTMNIGLIAGGVAENVIPASASADVMCRVSTNVDELWNLIVATVGERPGVRLVKKSTFEPVRCEVIDGFPSEVMKYNTDIGAWKKPVKAYLYGPGSIQCAHAPHEHINKREMLESVDGYKRLITTLLQK